VTAPTASPAPARAPVTQGARRRERAALAAGVVAAALLAGAPADAEDAPALRLQGDPQRGEAHYREYKCYACHGWSGQTGEPLTGPRLVPMQFPLPGFVAYVQRSPSDDMPAYPDAPEQALADMHAWLQGLEPDAPALDDTPLLRDIRQRVRDGD
jgi:hypothetical protein